MQGQIYELREMLQETGPLGKIRRLVNRCYNRIKDIETIAMQDGSGTIFGTANGEYLEFFGLVNSPSVSKANTVSKRYGEVQRLWLKWKR